MKPLTDNDPMPFGKYKGKPMRDVPATYLDWLYDQPWLPKWPRVAAYIDTNMNCVIKELKEQREI